jgi:hypothetical protein
VNKIDPARAGELNSSASGAAKMNDIDVMRFTAARVG